MASVQKHRDRWRVKWRDDLGRQLYDSFPTKAEANEAARAIEARTVLDGRPPLAPTEGVVTLARWWERWEPGRQWRTSTRETHGVHWRRYIDPVFGRVPLDQITTADVRKWHRRLEQRGLAPRTVAAIHRTLSMALQGAVEDELISRNPARAARLRRPTQSPPVALDQKTLSALLDAIEATTPALRAYAELLAATGMRRAEGVGLTWDRVDLEAPSITVDRQLDYSAPTLPAWCPTKTGDHRRIPLTSATVELLRAQRAAQSVVALKDALVFARDDGSAWPRSTLQDAWRRARAYLERDVPPAEAAAMLGHTPEQLLSTYAHVTDQAAADQRLIAALATGGTP